MKIRGIIFSGEMVRAIVDDRKSVTRRLDKSWLKYKKGDELWVRETFAINDHKQIAYRADGTVLDGIRWGFPRFMPRWASRITLTLTEDARLERLQDMIPAEIQKEGCPFSFSGTSPEEAPDWYGWWIPLWDSLHKPGEQWEDNPEVVRLCWGGVRWESK
ncbi:hypothetical protein ES708_00708 [subsurface metagenome]